MAIINKIGNEIGAGRIDPFMVAARSLANQRYQSIQSQGTTTISLSLITNFLYELMKIYNSKTLSNINILVFPQIFGMKSDGSIIYSLNDSTNFIQATPTKRPTYLLSNGISRAIFDGTKYTVSTSNIMPVSSQYIGVKMNAWSDGSTIMDGQVNNTCRLFQAVSTPDISAQSFTSRISPLISSNSLITRILNNSGASRFQLNTNTPISQTITPNTLSKITLGATGGLVYYSNMDLYFLLISNTLDSTNISNKVQNLLNKYCNYFFFEPLGLLGLTQFKDFMLS